MKITRKLLVEHGACWRQLEIFDALFPNGIVVSRTGVIALADVFSWDWAGHKLLSGRNLRYFRRVKKEALHELEIEIDETYQMTPFRFGLLARRLHQQKYNRRLAEAFARYAEKEGNK